MRILNFIKKTKPTKLGRWGVTYDSQVLEKRINWANHDHCGSEICEKHFVNEKNKEKEKKEVESWSKRLEEKKKLNSTKMSNVSKKNENEDEDDEINFYYVPYCL
tara:strand:+ start:298 stop:612 length:315 start_codon:yes stop_codon:yes gene_type:complete